MLRGGSNGVNAPRFRNCRHFADAMRAYGTHHAENQWTRLKIPLRQAVRAQRMAQPEQTCCGYGRCGETTRLEFRLPEKRRQAATRERFPRMRVPANFVISSGAASVLRSRPKMFSPERAAPTHRPATHRRLGFGGVARARRQKRGYTQGSLLAPHVFATLPSPRLVLHQVPARARPIPRRTKATVGLVCASRAANMRIRKTNSRTSSQKPILSGARKKPPRIIETRDRVSGFDYRRPSQNIANVASYCSIGRMRRSAAANWSAL